MKRGRVYAIALGFVLLALLLAGVQYRRAAVLRQQALETARRGATWLSALDIPLKDPGIPRIVSAIDGEYCHEPRVAGYVAQRFQEVEGRRDPIYTAMRVSHSGRGTRPSKRSRSVGRSSWTRAT